MPPCIIAMAASGPLHQATPTLGLSTWSGHPWSRGPVGFHRQKRLTLFATDGVRDSTQCLPVLGKRRPATISMNE